MKGKKFGPVRQALKKAFAIRLCKGKQIQTYHARVATMPISTRLYGDSAAV